jgi:hypothetical protein
MNKLFAAMVPAMMLAAPALAVTISPIPAEVGATWTTTYDAWAGNTTFVPGVTAEVKFTLDAITGNTWRITAEVDNTSPSGTTRLGSFGFNTDPNLASAVFFDAGDFGKILSGPSLTFSGGVNVELCVNPNAVNNCTGGGNDGFLPGDDVATTTFDLTFVGGAPTSVFFDNFYVRWQVLPPNGGSGVGRLTGWEGFDGDGDPLGVPEPASWAMLIAGFGLVGAVSRRRKAASLTVAA